MAELKKTVREKMIVALIQTLLFGVLLAIFGYFLNSRLEAYKYNLADQSVHDRRVYQISPLRNELEIVAGGNPVSSATRFETLRLVNNTVQSRQNYEYVASDEISAAVDVFIKTLADDLKVNAQPLKDNENAGLDSFELRIDIESIRNIFIIVGVLVATILIFIEKYRRRVDESIRVAEKELYDSKFSDVTHNLEKATRDLTYSNIGFFDLPSDIINDALYVFSHYQSIIERKNSKLIMEHLYRRLVGFRLLQSWKLIQPFLQSIRTELNDENWGKEIEIFMNVQFSEKDKVFAQYSGFLSSSSSRIFNMDAMEVVNYLESCSIEIRNPRYGHVDNDATKWFFLYWEKCPRTIKIKWVETRINELKKTIRIRTLGTLSNDDFYRELERLDESIEPSISAIPIS